MTWKFTGEDLAEECFPSGCCLKDYADTGTSKMQVTSEEAKVSQSGKQSLLLRGILSEGTEDLIELHDCSNLSSTVLNTKFENAHLFLSQYAGNLHTNNL